MDLNTLVQDLVLDQSSEVFDFHHKKSEDLNHADSNAIRAVYLRLALTLLQELVIIALTLLQNFIKIALTLLQ
jgi:hypothetical protein